MKKTFLLLFVALAVCCTLFSGCATKVEVGEELVKNGDFESVDGQYPAYWDFFSYGNGECFLVTHAEGENADEEIFGQSYLAIKNEVATCSYACQTIRVEPGAVYEVRANLSLPSSLRSSAAGAYIGFAENKSFTTLKKFASCGWKKSEYSFYFTTDMQSVTICLCLGSESTESDGVASFDNVSVKKVDEQVAARLSPRKLVYKSESDYVDPYAAKFLVICAILTVILFVSGALIFLKRQGNTPKVNENGKSDNFLAFLKNHWAVALVGVLAFAVRFALATNFYGFRNDVDLFVFWAKNLAENGPYAFYENTGCDYTPLYLYFLWICGLFMKNATTIEAMVISKIPSVLCDVASVFVVYKVVCEFGSKIKALVASVIFAFLPVIFVNSAIWGQVDGFLALALLLTVYFMMKENYVGIFASYTVAVLFKIQAAFIFPVIGAYLIYQFVKNKELRKKLVCYFAISLGVFYCVSLPFTISQFTENPFYIVYRYFCTIGQYNYYCLNASNFYAALGMNYEAASTVSHYLNVLFIAILSLSVAFAFLKRRELQTALLLSGFTVVAIFVFSIKMHERYLYPAIILLLVYACITSEKRVFFICGGFALLHFLNTAGLLAISGFLNPYMSGSFNAFSSNDPILLCTSVASVILTLYLGYVCFDIAWRGNLCRFNGKGKE